MNFVIKGDKSQTLLRPIKRNRVQSKKSSYLHPNAHKHYCSAQARTNFLCTHNFQRDRETNQNAVRETTKLGERINVERHGSVYRRMDQNVREEEEKK